MHRYTMKIEPFAWVMVALVTIMAMAFGLALGKWELWEMVLGMLLVICLLVLFRVYELLSLLIDVLLNADGSIRDDLHAILQRLARQAREG